MFQPGAELYSSSCILFSEVLLLLLDGARAEEYSGILDIRLL